MLKLPKRYTIKEIAVKNGLEKSAVRFYIQEVLPDYVAKHCGDIQVQERKATLYPQEILERIKFIKMVKTELSDSSNNRLKPTIRELRGWMNNISDEQVRDVVEGKDSIAFGMPVESQGTRQIKTLAGERLSEDSRKYGAQISAFSRAPEENSAAEYLDEIMPNAHKPRARRKPQSRTKQLKLGPDLEIHYPGNLSAKKEKQLKLTGELLRSIVTEED